jgi:uncharacterized protein YoaH (UPF0181 family)
MTDETVNALVDCIEKVLKRGGMQTLEDAGLAIHRLADILNQLTQFCNRERLTEKLKEIQLSPQDEMLIRGMTDNFPAMAVAIFQEALPIIRKEFPVINAGRPKALTTEQQRAACEHIGKLHAEGLNIKIAKRRAAQKFDVSVSTIDRTWAQRKQGHKLSAKEVLDILKAKQADKTKVLPASETQTPSSSNTASAKTSGNLQV